MINSQKKGKAYELEISKDINREFQANCKRTPCSGGLGFKGDILDLRGPMAKFHFELKKQEKLNIWKAMEQAKRDAPVGKSWVVIFSKNFSPDYVAISKETFYMLLHYMIEVDEMVKKEPKTPPRG